MGLQDTYINRKDNKLLYVLDTGLDKFVIFVIRIVRYIVPRKFKNMYDKLSEHKDLLHNVVGLAFFNALGGLCVMATQVKLANYLGASIYGIYSYCLAIGEVGAMFVRYGRNKTMVRDLIQYPEKRATLVVSTFFLSIINLILFLIIVLLCNEPLDIEVNWTYFLLILSPSFASLSLGPIYESLRMMSWSSLYVLLQKFCFLLAIWTLLLCHFHIDLRDIGIITVATWLIMVFMEYYEVGTQLKINFIGKVKLSELWNLYKDNFVIFLSCVTGVAYGPLIRMILNNFTDSKSVGIYAAGLQIYNISLFFNTQIARVGNPMMAEAGKIDCPIVRRRKLVTRYASIMVGTSLLFAIPMMFFPNLLTSILFSAEYESLGNYLPILGVYMLAMSIGMVFMQYMISLRLDKIYFSIYVTAALSTLFVAYWLIPQYNVLGAFLALCIPHSIGCLCYMLFSLKSLKNS